MDIKRPKSAVEESMAELLGKSNEDGIELYSMNVDHEISLDDAPDDGIEFINNFGSLDEAAEFAEANGYGWYLWSRPGFGKFLGSIHVTDSREPEIREF